MFVVRALNENLMWVLLASFAALATGTMVRLGMLRSAAADLVQSRLASLKTWWILALLLAAAIVLDRVGVALLCGLASFLGLREFARLVATRPSDRAAVIFSLALVPVHYGLIVLNAPWQVLALVPVIALLVLGGIQALVGDIQGAVKSTAGLVWGVLLLVYGLSFAALLLRLPESSNPVAGNAGWFLFLVILTESNDIAQALVGRVLGRHKLVPGVSPKKTWEGLAGGVAGTLLLAFALSPWLTPWSPGHSQGESSGIFIPYLWPVVAALAISICGFLGDIHMSLVKRDVGVKDGSDALPGQGGVIDRIDSLTFTAPVFYILVSWLTRLS